MNVLGLVWMDPALSGVGEPSFCKVTQSRTVWWVGHTGAHLLHLTRPPFLKVAAHHREVAFLMVVIFRSPAVMNVGEINRSLFWLLILRLTELHSFSGE